MTFIVPVFLWLHMSFVGAATAILAWRAGAGLMWRSGAWATSLAYMGMSVALSLYLLGRNDFQLPGQFWEWLSMGVMVLGDAGIARRCYYQPSAHEIFEGMGRKRD